MDERPSSLQSEIRQKRPFRSASHEAAIGLLRTTDLVRRHFLEVLAPYGITLPQYNVLRVLRGAGKDGLPTLEVAERLIEHAPGITRMMDRLEKRGWVRRERCAGDRRQVLCFLTDEGRRLLSEVDDCMNRADEQALSGLSEAQQRELIWLLDQVRAAYR
ncbi:MAG: MarR family transcriptional regulator [Gemmatimonadales bacterium]